MAGTKVEKMVESWAGLMAEQMAVESVVSLVVSMAETSVERMADS
jgi:hypothetical protein